MLKPVDGKARPLFDLVQQRNDCKVPFVCSALVWVHFTGSGGRKPCLMDLLSDVSRRWWK
jgi:hypothetical protein